MDNLINNIVLYLKYLNNDCKLNVSVHFKTDVFDCLPMSVVAKLLPYNCHTSAYCVMVKNADQNKCLLNQRDILVNCKKGKPFCNICHAGVKEYIYPICKDDNAVGFVAVSGYRENSSDKNKILSENLWRTILNPEVPFELCNAVIPPVCFMLERALDIYLKENRNEYNQIVQFLNEYHTDVNLSDLAKYFNRSESHISHLFKKESGVTLRAYCNSLKLKDAQRFLINTEMPVTEVAINSGFNETSYFIQLFKSEFGITPLKYRQEKIYTNKQN